MPWTMIQAILRQCPTVARAGLTQTPNASTSRVLLVQLWRSDWFCPPQSGPPWVTWPAPAPQRAEIARFESGQPAAPLVTWRAPPASTAETLTIAARAWVLTFASHRFYSAQPATSL